MEQTKPVYLMKKLAGHTRGEVYRHGKNRRDRNSEF